MNNNSTNKYNISFLNKITWYDINENGYIKEYLKKQSVLYIYRVISSNNKTRYYVGSSINILNRLSDDRSRVIRWSKSNCSSGSPIFYNSVLKYGWSSFQLDILEHIDLSKYKFFKEKKNNIFKKEQYYLDKIKPSLNVCEKADSPLGIKRNVTFSINLSKAKRGKKHGKLKMKISIIPNIISVETRLKMSERARGVSVKVFDKKKILLINF